MRLDITSLRLIGCLVEKEMTTPDYYPMTVNGLTAAANQKSNREPVMTLSEQQILDGLNGLREQGLVRTVRSPGGRAVKYKHALDDVLEVDREQRALLAVLALRGPQTAGELRLRTERYHEFPDLAAVEEVLDGLQRRAQALVERLERRPGEKEARYRHLLGGEPEPVGEHPEHPSAIEPGRDDLSELRRRLEALEQRVDRLEREP